MRNARRPHRGRVLESRRLRASSACRVCARPPVLPPSPFPPERTLVALIVQKYGGSSVADATSVKRVAKRIAETKRAGNDVVVVVSAMGDTTDELIGLAHEITPIPPSREMDILLTAGERISMSLLAMAIANLGVDARSF